MSTFLPGKKKFDQNIKDKIINFPQDKSKLRICFTGNIGEAQNFENIMIAANILKNKDDIEWIIIGTGRNIEQIKKYKKENNIKIFIF